MVKKGDKYKCEDCGIVLLVDNACGCGPCDIVCCGEPMKKVEEKPTKPEAKPVKKK